MIGKVRQPHKSPTHACAVRASSRMHLIFCPDACMPRTMRSSYLPSSRLFVSRWHAQLIEEIMFIRNLRRELSSISAALSDGGSGLDSQGQGRGKAGGSGKGAGGKSGGLPFDLMGMGITAVGSAKGNETGQIVRMPSECHLRVALPAAAYTPFLGSAECVQSTSNFSSHLPFM